MGIINVTPDSFSDGGRHFDAGAAIGCGEAMVRDGADILDIGGESTRPGATALSVAEEQARILPVIEALRGTGVPISVDTRNAATMAAALDAGASIVNDVSALQHDPAAAALVAQRGCPVILMHMRGVPETMGNLAQYQDVAVDVARELGERVAAAEAAGIRRENIATDPGIGFAKHGHQNVELLQGLANLRALGCPIVVGVSRKRFIGALTGPGERDSASLAAGLYALGQGATILRVHDVAMTVRAVRVWHTLAA
jgi:dihydropteroate synthase